MMLATVGRMLHRPPISLPGPGACYAATGLHETVQHFVDDCKFLAPCRDRMMRELHSAVPLAGEAGAWRVHVLRLSRGDLLNCILARPDAGEAVNEMEGFVDWLVDKVIKTAWI